MKLSLTGLEEKRALLIAGPTASGKSQAAREAAEDLAAQGLHAWIVNADSMQVYDALRLLTARPSADDEARLPHRLYGHVRAETRYSVAAWLHDVSVVLVEAEAAGALPIIVGGTGLYFTALTEGLAPVPAVPVEIRARWSDRLRTEGAAALHGELRTRDPGSAEALRPSDAQRVMRALEVLDATGRPLGEWQQGRAAPPLLPAHHCARLVIEPERATLYGRIEQRFDRMLGEGALGEVRELLRRELDPALPVMKAIGVREFASVLRKELLLEDAVRRAKTETRRYAKRQMTWLRNRMSDWPRMVV